MGRVLTILSLGICLSIAPWISLAEELLPDASRAILEARVIRIYDGDTVEVDLGANHPRILWEGVRLFRYERVRLLGIDAPELSTDPPEFYAREAKSLLFRLVSHRTVRLEVVPGNERDGYRRLLAYVYVKKRDGWIFVNGELVRRGAADLLFVGTERYAEYLRELWIEAVAARRGMWGRYPGVITVADIYADPLKYALEGVTVTAGIAEVKMAWDGFYILCERNFWFFIPRERVDHFNEAGLSACLKPGVKITASGVLKWLPFGPIVELWGPLQVHTVEPACKP
ncbi:thermonuclease family protein [Candidatus Bipolaricaulota sp. J31]